MVVGHPSRQAQPGWACWLSHVHGLQLRHVSRSRLAIGCGT